MIQVADNFNYRGKKPNFDRDSFDTLQDMKNYSENSLDDGHISYCKETDKHYKFNSNNQSDPTTGKWVEQHEAVPADEEDITEQNGTLQLANKTYDKQSFSGLGRVYLRKNIVGDKNVLTQAMINKANTIYVIQYDYDLKVEIIKYSSYLEGLEYTKYRAGKLTILDNKEAFFPLLVLTKDNNVSNMPTNSSSTFKYFVYNSQTKKLSYRYGDNLYYINSTIVTEDNQRPSLSSADKGTMFFDSTLNKPIWYNGSNWVDATGVIV